MGRHLASVAVLVLARCIAFTSPYVGRPAQRLRAHSRREPLFHGVRLSARDDDVELGPDGWRRRQPENQRVLGCLPFPVEDAMVRETLSPREMTEHRMAVYWRHVT